MCMYIYIYIYIYTYNHRKGLFIINKIYAKLLYNILFFSKIIITGETKTIKFDLFLN